jgi:hypothetical protein
MTNNDLRTWVDSTRANIEACERLLGRALTNPEKDSVHLMVGRMLRYGKELNGGTH